MHAAARIGGWGRGWFVGMAGVAACLLVGAAPQSSFDLLIINGRLIDGSGNPWRRADVAIRGDRVAAVGHFPGAAAGAIIDAKDRVVAPGFIDAHSHALETITRAELRDARPLLAQGLTTIIGNPDGGGPTDLARQAAALGGEGGLGINAALLIGHGSVRDAVMGSARRDPTPEELDRMRAIVRRAVADGAFGFSSGLFYIPGRFAKLDEVIALAKEAGGVYTSHIRDEGDYDIGVIAAVDEVIRVAGEANVRGVVTHVKTLGPDNWGKSAAVIERIDAARARGIDMYADQYPYAASSTSLSAAVMPGQSDAAMREAMSGEESRKAFLAFVRENVRRRGGPASIVIASGRGASDQAGKSLADIAAARQVAPEQAAVDVALAGGASIVSFNMSDADVDAFMRQPWTMASSDGGLMLPGASRPHPRNNGAFSRRLAHYVRARGVLTLEQAIRTMTSLTARVFDLPDRGEIRAGAYADLVVFDPATVADRATYDRPHELAAGMEWVIVNGQIACKAGEFTGARAGRVLKKRP